MTEFNQAGQTVAGGQTNIGGDVPAPAPRRHISPEELERWFQYHAPSGKAVTLHEGVRNELGWLAKFFNDTLPEGPSKTLSLRALEQAMFHANAAIAREPSLHDQPETVGAGESAS